MMNSFDVRTMTGKPSRRQSVYIGLIVGSTKMARPEGLNSEAPRAERGWFLGRGCSLSTS